MIVNSMLIRRGLPVTVVMAATILLQPSTASAGGGHFSLSVGVHYPFYGHHHGHHFRVYRPAFYGAYVRPYGYYPTPVAAPALRGGAVDLAVKPKQTQVYVDGAYVGTAGKFDGYPDYLWLPPGRHRLSFYRPGFGTVEQTIEVRAGFITDVALQMAPLAPGESSVRPTAPAAPPAPSAPPEPTAPPRAPARPPAGAPPVTPPTGGEAGVEPAAETGSVRLAVTPEDASVYLDGRFLGTATQLQRLRAGLLVDAGSHLLEVVHPRYESERLTFRLAPDEEVEVTIDLDALEEAG